MATTSPDNIWTPDAGDDYALTTDLAAMADTVQDAITANRVGGIGTNAERLALTGGDLFEGLTFRTTDTKLDWVYTSGAWSKRMAPFAMATGTATIGTSETTVTLPAGVFTQVPKILPSPLAPAGDQVGVAKLGTGANAPTTTNFKVRIFNLSGASIGGTLDWTAIQMTG